MLKPNLRPVPPVVDLSHEMAELAGRLGPVAGGPGRVIQFVSAESGEGASTVAREFARQVSAGASRGVWLVELDLLSGDQFNAIAVAPELYGELGEATRASPDGSVFFTVDPKLQGVDGRPWADAQYLDAHQVGDARWWVTRFRREVVRAGQTVRILNTPAYWNALRAYADHVIIDAPAAERSRAALVAAAQADANVLVVAGDRRNTTAPLALRDAIAEAGGYCAGLVFNRAGEEPPEFLSSLLP